MAPVRNFFIAATVAASIGLPSTASAFRALNSLDVNSEGPVTFEVIQSGGIGPGDAWCAAGDYALRALGAASNQRVYLIEGKHIARTEQRRRYGYSFSLSAPPEAETIGQRLTLSLRAIGDSLSVANARQYCYDRLGPDEILRP